MTRSGVLVLLSGGIDSALVLDRVAEEFGTVHTLHVTYGQQTADIEANNAQRQADRYGTVHHTVDLTDTVAQYAEGVADDAAEFVDQTHDDGRSTGYVPMRNLTLLAVAAGFADSHDLEAVAHGAQSGDRDDYPDCRPAFVDAAAEAVRQSLPEGDSIEIRTPLLDHTKQEVVREAVDRGVRLENTYSCYAATDAESPDPCGKCPACRERIAAFEDAGITDPLLG